jgi:hypothetical protein
MAILSGFGGMINNIKKTKEFEFWFLAVNCPYTYMTYFIKVRSS